MSFDYERELGNLGFSGSGNSDFPENEQKRVSGQLPEFEEIEGDVVSPPRQQVTPAPRLIRQNRPKNSGGVSGCVWIPLVLIMIVGFVFIASSAFKTIKTSVDAGQTAQSNQTTVEGVVFKAFTEPNPYSNLPRTVDMCTLTLTDGSYEQFEVNPNVADAGEIFTVCQHSESFHTTVRMTVTGVKGNHGLPRLIIAIKELDESNN